MTKRRPAHWYAVTLIVAASTLPCRGLAADAETAEVTVTAPRMTEAERQAPTSFV